MKVNEPHLAGVRAIEAKAAADKIERLEAENAALRANYDAAEDWIKLGASLWTADKKRSNAELAALRAHYEKRIQVIMLVNESRLDQITELRADKIALHEINQAQAQQILKLCLDKDALRTVLVDARRYIVMACGETSPHAKIMLARIDAFGVVDSPVDAGVNG